MVRIVIDQIKDILKIEFLKLIDNMTEDIRSNYIKKNHNFLLSELDESMTAHLVFVSSFESKSGNVIQECARQIAELKYGKENVPRIINLSGYDLEPYKKILENTREQIIVTKTNLESQKVKETIKGYITVNQGTGRGSNRRECNVTQDSIKELLYLNELEQANSLHFKPVDLAFYDGEYWNVMEIKAGGDLDSSNAPSNVEKILNVYVALNQVNSKVYFSTFYNKNGEGNTWTGAVKKFLSYPEMFLVGSQFWNKILPSTISFEDFKQLYSESMNELGLNEKLNLIIQSCFND